MYWRARQAHATCSSHALCQPTRCWRRPRHWIRSATRCLHACFTSTRGASPLSTSLTMPSTCPGLGALNRVNQAVEPFSLMIPWGRAIFEFVLGLLPLPGGMPFSLEFEEVPDALEDKTADARRAKEAAALEGFRKTVAQWHESRPLTMRAAVEWLFHEHKAYAASRLLDPVRPLDPALLNSY